MTTAPVRMRLSRARGFRLQEASAAINGLPAVNCARPGKWGNPFIAANVASPGMVAFLRLRASRLGRTFCNTAEEAAAAFVAMLTEEHVELIKKELAQHNLACWCPMPELGGPDHCHAAVLLEIANRNWRLVELLKQAAQHKMTPEEIEAQRQSWVRGELALSEWERSVTKVSRCELILAEIECLDRAALAKEQK